MIGGASFLRNVPVLAGLSDELLEQLAAQITERHFNAGEWVLREGDVADSLFIVRSGRIEVIDEGPPESLIRVLRRGEVLGELALLREGTRSASARARRDAQLLELGRAPFEELIRQAPSFALGLTRAMGAQLAASRMPVFAAAPPRTVAVVGMDDGAPVAEVAEALADALAGHESIARLRAGDLATIDRAERGFDRVLMCCSSVPHDEWTDLCVREAHLVLAVTSGAIGPAWAGRTHSLQGCELLVLGPAVSATTLQELQPRQVQVVSLRAQRKAAMEAMARRIAGRSLGIVLSGGGARALAHLGVLEELRAQGLQFDRIAGVSLGSLVAAGTAAGFSAEALRESFERSFVKTNPSRDFVPPAYSLIRGSKTRKLIREAFGERRIEELPLRFFSVSCDLVAREPVLHRVGPVVDAVYPSLAIPGIFPPVATREGRLLVDGGVLDNLPVAAMARTGEGPVIAVDVTGRMGHFTNGHRRHLPRLGRTARRALTGGAVEIPLLGETIVRSVTVGSTDTVTAARLHADVVITPPVEGIALMDWKALPRVIEIGRRAAREALSAHPDLLDQFAL